MPARKNSSLNKRHDTKKDKRARESAEAALIPTTKLTLKPPAALSGHKIASTTWTRLLSLYDETKGEIITAFDQDVLVTYCKLIEEEINLEKKVVELDMAQQEALHVASKTKPTKDNFKDYVLLWVQVNGLTANFRGMDARLDGKRKHRLALEQSLYLTPRSRAGVAPEEKDPEKPESEMDKLLS